MKTWNEKFDKWLQGSASEGVPILIAPSRKAYHAGRKHQRKATQEASEKNAAQWHAHMAELKEKVEDMKELYDHALRERNGYQAKCRALVAKKVNLHLEIGSLRNQKRMQSEELEELRKKPWWRRKFWRIDW